METSEKDQGLKDFLAETLGDLYAAEKKFIKCAGALSMASDVQELQTALKSQSDEADNHIERLELVFGLTALRKQKQACVAIDALAEKAACMVRQFEAGSALRDAAIIYAVQLITHYKIASYGCAAALVEELELPEAALLLQQSLSDEKNADAYLSQIAMNFVNPAAKKEQEE